MPTIKRILLIPLFLFILSCNERILKKEYYSNGTIKEEYYCIKNKREGESKLYYPNGKLWAEPLYKDGYQEGLTKVYYPDGKLQKLVYYHKGIPQDTQKVFYENGNIQEICYLINAEKYGDFEMFFSNGKIKEKGNLFDGYQDGCWETFDSTTGFITNISIYETDTLKNILGEKIAQIDSNDLILKPIDNSSLPFSISFPSNWGIIYNYNKILVGVAKPFKIEGNSIDINLTITKDTLKGKTFSQYIDGNLKGLIEGKHFIKLISHNKLEIDGTPADELVFYGKYNNVYGCSLITSILEGHTIYMIVCTSPIGDMELYANLFREIINTINFKGHQNT